MITKKNVTEDIFIVSGRMLDEENMQYIDGSNIKTIPLPIGQLGDFAAVVKKEEDNFRLISAKPLEYGSFSVCEKTFITFSESDISQVRKKADDRFLIILKAGAAVIETGYFEKNAPYLFELEKEQFNVTLQTNEQVCVQVI